ncbi:protein kinase [bacterium]|nr:protein kinase [bacterium]
MVFSSRTKHHNAKDEQMLGTMLNHYRIETQLGRGGMGEVFVAEDTRLKRKVALKVLRSELSQDPDRLKRFEREVKTLASLNHPNIVTIYSVEESEGLHFFTMELVRGKTLSELIPQDGIPLQTFFNLTVPLTDALRIAHAQGITHRDLKPDNIIVCEDGRLKILDFGLAKLRETEAAPLQEVDIDTDSVTDEGVVIGTVAYMSPEQAQGKPVDPRSDIFSLGILLYQMITGHHPFQGENSIELISSILKDKPKAITEYNTGIPRALWEITNKCLDKDPDRRYQSSSDLHSELAALKADFSSGELQTTVTGQYVPLRAPEMLRQPRRWGMAIALLMVLLLGAAVYYYRGNFSNRTINPAPILPLRPTVAVLNFENLTGTTEFDWLCRGLPGMLLTGLAQTTGLNVISSQRIQELTNKFASGSDVSLDRTAISRISQQAGATAVVYGSIYQAGLEIRIDAQVEDVGSGHLLTAQNVRGRDVFALVDQLVAQIRKSLDLGYPQQSQSITDITTNSLKAYQLYTEGLEARMSLRWKTANELFQRAIELDPNFAMAQFELSRLHKMFAPLMDSQNTQDLREKVLANIDRLPERQKLLVQSVYALERETEDYLVKSPLPSPDKARELLETLISKYPDEEEAYILLAALYSDHYGDPKKGLDILHKGVLEMPKSGPIRNHYAYFLQATGQHTEAFQSLQVYLEVDPDEPNPYDSLGEAYLKIGQPEKAVDYYTRAIELDPTFSSAFSGKIYGQMMLGNYSSVLEQLNATGQRFNTDEFFKLGIRLAPSIVIMSSLGMYASASEYLEKTLEQSAESLSQFEEAWLRLVMAMVHLEHHQPQKARLHTDRANALLQPMLESNFISQVPILTHFITGLVNTHLQEFDSTRHHLAEMKSLSSENDSPAQWWTSLLEAELFLAEGKLSEAVAAFQKAESEAKLFFTPARIDNIFDHQLPFRDGLARVRIANGDDAGALAVYQDLITPDIGDKLVSPLTPRFVLAMARLYERLDQTEKARASYQRFLDLWQNADQNLPELIETKQFLADHA